MPRAAEFYADRGLFHLSDQIALAGLSWVGGGMADPGPIRPISGHG